MIKAIIFDFDGVIVESAEIKTRAFQKLFEGSEKLKDIVDYHLQYMGLSRYEKFRYIYQHILNLPLNDVMEKELGDKFSKLVLEEVLRAPFVEGVREFLQNNYQSHLLFIASGTPEDELRYIVSRKGIAHFFRETHGSPAHKPDIISDVLKRFNLLPGEVVFVGDAESDMNAAMGTGLHFILRKTSEVSSFLLTNCPYQLDSLQGLSTLIKGL